jgi:hypothetical protein
MDVPVTLAIFTTILAALVLLRIRWPSLPVRLQSTLIVLAMVAIFLQGLTYATHWNLSDDRAGFLLNWSAIIGYEFIVLLATRLRPRWLTSIVAVILILPLLSASIFLPLTGQFERSPHYRTKLDTNLYIETTPWESPLKGTSGVDIQIFVTKPYIPFLRHLFASSRLFNNQCNTAGATVVLQLDHENVLISCPSWSGELASSYLLSLN